MFKDEKQIFQSRNKGKKWREQRGVNNRIGRILITPIQKHKEMTLRTPKTYNIILNFSDNWGIRFIKINDDELNIKYILNINERLH